MNIVGKPITITLHEGFQPEFLREGPTNYINATFLLERDVTTVAYIFTGPRNPIRSVAASRHGSTGVTIKMDISGVVHEAKIATSWRSWSAKVSAAQLRIRFLGFPGYACVRVHSKLHRFGFNANSHWLAKRLPRDAGTALSTGDVSHYRMTSLYSQSSMPALQYSATEKDPEEMLLKIFALVMVLTGFSLLFSAVMATRLSHRKTMLTHKTRYIRMRFIPINCMLHFSRTAY